MVANPQEHAVVPIHPRPSALLRKVYGRVGAVPVIHHQAVLAMLDGGVLVDRRKERVVLLPDGRHEPLAACIADGHVREKPVVVVGDQRLREADPVWMVRARGEDVVAQGSAAGIRDPHRVVKKRRQIRLAALRVANVSTRSIVTRAEGTNVVQIEVDATVVHQNEVPNSIDALDGEAISVVRPEEPWVVRLDKVARALLRPKLYSAQSQ